jgi:hypothetical protein
LHLSTSFRLFDLRSQRSVHALWRFGPTARTFGFENPSIFRHHIVLINRVKKSTLVQIGLQLYLSTLFRSSTLFLLVLNTTACTMHCISGAMSFSPKGKNNVIVPSEEAGHGFGQVSSVSSHKVRKDALHLPSLLRCFAPSYAKSYVGLSSKYLNPVYAIT